MSECRFDEFITKVDEKMTAGGYRIWHTPLSDCWRVTLSDSKAEEEWFIMIQLHNDLFFVDLYPDEKIEGGFEYAYIVDVGIYNVDLHGSRIIDIVAKHNKALYDRMIMNELK